MPIDGPCVFTEKQPYTTVKKLFDDNNGHTLLKNQPLFCDKTAAIASFNRSDIFISESTYHYNGGGCC
jgi:hypothetical protein